MLSNFSECAECGVEFVELMFNLVELGWSQFAPFGKACARLNASLDIVIASAWILSWVSGVLAQRSEEIKRIVTLFVTEFSHLGRRAFN